MYREFSIVRVKKQVLASWEFPLAIDEVEESPLAGPFDELTADRLFRATGAFPFAVRVRDGRKAWSIAAPKRGQLDAWLTSDGCLFVEGEMQLNLIYGLYVHLMQTFPDIVVEDRITGVLHNRSSLLRLVRREEERNLPFELGDNPETTPPLAA
ncbi:MAG: hypothetical protein AB1938_09000 [Myxococcota bacterium]